MRLTIEIPAGRWNPTVRLNAAAAVVMAVSLLLSSSPAVSQVTSGIADLSRREGRRLSPEEIPQQVLVSMFFLQVVSSSGDPDERMYHLLLAKLAIPPGSDGDQALAQAARSALKVIDWPEWPDVAPSLLGGADAAQFNADALLRKATGLADIYGDLLVRLSSIEDAAERVAAYVENKRYTVTSTQIGELSLAAIASEETFAARVRELLEEKLPERFKP